MKILFIFVTATVLYVSATKITKPENHASNKVNSTKLSAVSDDKRGKRTLSNFGNGFTYQNYYDRNLGQGYSTSRSYNPYDGTQYNTAISGSPHYSSNLLTSGNSHLQFPYHPYLNPPEPIIEIIIKDSNDTIVHPPQPIIPKKKKEKVHVYYVKYKKGEDNKLHLDEPIASLNNDDEKLDLDEEDIVDYASVVTPLPSIKPTTLRTVIHPDSEKFHSSNAQVHVTFGSENKSKIGHRIEEHNAESVRQSVVAVPIKSFQSSYQKAQRNYNDPQKYQQLPQIRSRSSFQISSGPVRPHFDHYQQLPQQQTHVNFRPPASQHQPIQQFSQSIYQSQPFNQQQFNTKPFFGSSFHQHQKEPQRQQFLPTPPPSSQLLPFLNNIQQNQQFFGPSFQQNAHSQQYQSTPPTPPPPPQEQQLQHHQPQPIPLNTEFVPSKLQHHQQEPYVPPSPPVQPQYHQIQNHHFQPQSIHVQSQSQPHSHSSQSQSQSQAQSQYQAHSSKNQAQFYRSPAQQHQTPQQHQSHSQKQQQQNFNYQPNQYQYTDYYHSNYQENKPLAVQPLQKEPSEPQYNQHPASDAVTALKSKFNTQPSKQTELLKAIPKYEQHITETVNITPNYDHTYSQTINGNYSNSQGHFITAGSQESHKDITNYVTTPKAFVPQPSSQRPQYVHSQNGEHVQIVTPMPSTSIYNLQQQQSLLSNGKSSVLFPNSQSKLGYSSPYSVSTLYSDAFQELEKKKDQYSALLKEGFDRNIPNYSSPLRDQPSLSAAVSTPSSTPSSKPKIELPDEVPDDLRQQLFSSGILNNADISILDYDKVGDTALENLPQEHLQHFYGAGGGAQISESNKVFNVVKPNGDSVHISEKDVEVIKETGEIPKKNVELKVVRLDSDSKKMVTKYIKEDASVLPVVDLSSEKIYSKYLPVKVNGAQFPIPDVEELQGKIISNVVVLAPVDSIQSSEIDEREERDTSNGSNGDNLKALVKKPTKENFKKWLAFEAKQSVEQQSVILLVLKNSSGEREIYLYDISNDSVNKLSGELSTAFVNVAEDNASTENLENASLHAEEIMEETKKDQS